MKQKLAFKKCPRCGWKSFEQLKTHSHCVNCLHFEVHDDEEFINEF